MALAVIVKSLGATTSKGTRLKVQRADHDSSKGDITKTYELHGIQVANTAQYAARNAVSDEDVAFLMWADEVYNWTSGASHGATGIWARGSLDNSRDVYVKVGSNNLPAAILR